MTQEELIEMLRASCDKDRVDPEQNGFWVIVTEELVSFAKLVEEKAIKEALAQPEQEPVAWMNDSTPSGIFARHMEGARNFGCTIPLYTTPPQRKPLSDEEIDKAMAENKQTLIDAADNYWKMRRAYARIIEAAHGIKE